MFYTNWKGLNGITCIMNIKWSDDISNIGSYTKNNFACHFRLLYRSTLGPENPESCPSTGNERMGKW